MNTERKQADQDGRKIEEADMDNLGDGTDEARRDLEKVSGSAEAVWDEAFLVTFDQNEAQNPLNWTTKRKWGVTAAISGTGFVRIMMMAPAIDTMAEELDMSITESTMALSVYLLARAFGPLIIGPLSEIYGRKSIFHITNIWFLVWNLVCGFSRSKGLLISARLLAGFGASAVYSLGYGVLGDVWSAEQRGRSLSLYSLIPLTGSAVGQIISGFIVKYSTWRWMFWSTAIPRLILELSSSLLFHESYAPLLLRRRAEKLRSDTGDSCYHAAIEIREAGLSPLRRLSRSLSRPLRLLAFHPIIQMQAILEVIDYGLLYFALTTPVKPKYLSFAYHFYSRELSSSPLAFFSTAGPRNTTLFGWSSTSGAALLSLGMQIFDTTLHAYVMDSYPEQVSSASAATQVLRSLLAFAFPLFSNSLYDSLGYGWGNSLLAFLSIGVALPATGILWRWGAKLRGRQQYSY
ncbi:MFS transporter [Aspergillus arachidicola]|uniref:MFS transporter n=1 Tax=Aspergillus arachidicola TaxID=656916 RepID=A0A2G7FWI6_9EURO|nr:MFS transporter [Aspergillus arachidicola]